MAPPVPNPYPETPLTAIPVLTELPPAGRLGRPAATSKYDPYLDRARGATGGYVEVPVPRGTKPTHLYATLNRLCRSRGGLRVYMRQGRLFVQAVPQEAR